jgi:hypothetical protein
MRIKQSLQLRRPSSERQLAHAYATFNKIIVLQLRAISGLLINRQNNE